MLENLRRERDDLHEILRAQFAGDGAEDAGAPRSVGRVDDHDRVAVEAQIAAVSAADRSLRANDDGLGHFALLWRGLRRTLLDVDSDDVSDVGGMRDLAFAADHRGLAGASGVGDFKNGTQLNHDGLPRFGILEKKTLRRSRWWRA